MIDEGSIIHGCMNFFIKSYFLFIDRIEHRLAFGGSARVFQVVNVSTGEKKALKIIPVSSKGEIEIGMLIGRKSQFLVHYDEAFSEKNNMIIIMKLFSDGDLQTYLGSGKKLKENVFFF
jgi:serine/threonine protein kinase